MPSNPTLAARTARAQQSLLEDNLTMSDRSIRFDPSSDEKLELRLDDAIVELYGLERWSREFSLMTAGYRDPLDPEDGFNPEAPFNLLTIAILAEAKARVFKGTGTSWNRHVHIGGEVRPHTQAAIKVMARVYAAHGYEVHVRGTPSTTPIWYSSFGIFVQGYQSGDNFTASHSPYFKGGWKPLDADGKQLTDQEPALIQEVQRIVDGRETITLAPWRSSGFIFDDFDVDALYVAYQRSVLGEATIDSIRKAGSKGLRCLACPCGGAMGATTSRIFHALGIPTGPGGVVDYFFGEEDSRCHGIGELEVQRPDGKKEKQHFGTDPCKSEVYKNVGAQERLAKGEADLVILWDPDGDRFNIVTPAPRALAAAASDAGLEAEEFAGSDKCIVYFTPNQLYFMLAAFRIDLLKASGRRAHFDWFVASGFPGCTAISELAQKEKIPMLRVPVGFKNLGDLCRALEVQSSGPKKFRLATGEEVEVGRNPRALFLCEESGGANLGGEDQLRSHATGRTILSLREKDGMQMALLTLALASRLHETGRSFAEHYIHEVQARGIRFRFAERKDRPLYSEKILGEKLDEAKAEATRQRDQVMDYFHQLAMDHKAGRLDLEGVRREILARATTEAPHLSPLVAARWVEEDGPLFDFTDARVMVRASGTDAVLRYYAEGHTREVVRSATQLFSGLRLERRTV
jgi:phosphomannomutase